MAQRTKPYTKKLLLVDLILLFVTGGHWIILMAVRELYRWR